jgi:hypothetical protein
MNGKKKGMVRIWTDEHITSKNRIKAEEIKYKKMDWFIVMYR